MKKKLNSLSDLSTIKFDNLSADKEDIVDPIDEEYEKLHFELHFSKKGRSGKIVTLVRGIDIDKDTTGLAANYNVRSIPFTVVVDEEKVKSKTGLLTSSELKSFILD